MRTLVLYVFLSFSLSSIAQMLAFPGAEGAGAYTSGGRNGDVYHVINLNNSGAGSLRYGLDNAPPQGRTIVFDISGDIKLTGTLNITKPNITIAGQTAPGKGICIGDYRMNIDTSNIIIRHIRFRPSQIGGDGDAFGIKSGHNIMIDHCSMSWSSDEVLSTSNSPIDSVTIQWTYIYEGLNISYHYENGILLDHSMGSLFTTTQDSAIFSIHHCLYAHNRTRNPKPTVTDSGDLLFFDFRNNVIYDWGTKAGYSSDDPTRMVEMNYVGNYLIAGLSTDVGSRLKAFDAESAGITIYQEENKIDGNVNGVFDGSNTGWAMFDGPYFTHATPYNLPAVTTESADSALVHVLQLGGAFPWQRDIADARLVNGVYTGTGSIIDSVVQVGGYETLAIITQAISFDTDRDGMSDAWEIANGLDPNADLDRFDSDGDGYLNLEDYLNDLAELKMLTDSKLIAINSDFNAKIWPNPCKYTAVLEINCLNPTTLNISIYNMLGKKVMELNNQHLLEGLNKLQLDVSSLQQGEYLVNFESITLKLIVK
jgi:pectate lyase